MNHYLIKDPSGGKVFSGDMFWILNNTKTAANPVDRKMGLSGSVGIVGTVDHLAASSAEKLWNSRDREKTIDFVFEKDKDLNRIKELSRKGDWKNFEKLVKDKFSTEIGSRATRNTNDMGQITKFDTTTNLTDRYVNNQPITILSGAIYRGIGDPADVTKADWNYKLSQKEQNTYSRTYKK